jgi:AraC family transcriptional regulator, transcriptional activator of pobA
LDNRYAQPSIEVNEAQFAEVLHTIALLTNEKKRADCSNEIVQSLLHILLLQIQRCVDGQTTVPVSKRYVAQFKQFRLLLERDFAQNRTAGDFAQDMFITQHHLNHICKAVTGRTATEVIRGRSILEAQRMLSFTDKPVGEIAAELGYFDSSYFAKMFRAEVGCSALEFRKKY